MIKHIRVLSFMRRWIALHPEDYQLIGSVGDVEDCKRSGKLGITFDIEGMCPVEDDLSLVQTFYELGVRWMLIAYNLNNRAGGGCLDTDCGLTATGRAIIDEMERVGMVLCLSHTGAKTAAEALTYSRNPVIFSHSNANRVHAHPRNISDDLMRACAAKGGVIGINGIGSFLGTGENFIEQFLGHLHYAVDLVGAEHVGVGLDYVFDQAEDDDDLVGTRRFTLPDWTIGCWSRKPSEPLSRLSGGAVSAMRRYGRSLAAIGCALQRRSGSDVRFDFAAQMAGARLHDHCASLTANP